jgi:enterochelin esterase-like enzyme
MISPKREIACDGRHRSSVSVGVFNAPAAFNGKVRLLWLGAGSAEKRFGKAIQGMHAALDQAGVKHVVFMSPGTAHEWQTWRRSLYDFAPRLFRSGDKP